MFCQNCGQNLSDDAKFCENCGALTAPQSAAPAAQSPSPPYQQPVQPAYQQPAATPPPYQQPSQPVYQQPYAYQKPPVQQAYGQGGYQQPVQPAYQQPYGYGAAPVKKKSKAGLIVGIILGVVVLVVGVIVLVSVLGKKDIANVAMSATVDEDTYKPINATKVFYTDTPTIHCTLTSNLPVGTLISTEWAFEDTTYETATIDYTTKVKPEQIDYSIDMPAGGWMIGKYTVAIFVEGKQKTTINFEVKSSGGTVTPTTPASSANANAPIIDMKTAASIDESTALPINPQTVFTTDTPTIYATFTVNNLPVGSTLEIDWIYTTTNYEIDTLSYTTTLATEYLWTNFQMPEGGWPAGEYTVDVYVDGTYADSAKFTVE